MHALTVETIGQNQNPNRFGESAMHSAIIWVHPPDDFAGEKWQGLLQSTRPLKNSPAVSQLAENVWLVNFQEAPALFARLVAACDHHKFSYGILPLEHEPQWLPAGPGPKTT